MSDGVVAIARIDGQVNLVQIVQCGRSASHVQAIKYTLFGDKSFLANLTSTPPFRLATKDILEFLPSSVAPMGDTLTLTQDLFAQFVQHATANQTRLDEKWQRALAAGGVHLPHAR
ncbi:hypothetical protein FRC14_006273 [Serendipita sp. 396]|nr:hypothetical protein FRC14_006273 [Serendipita sp. 396]KAG8789638.1 hypothetical protein FRC15_006370 [Serendipita sp. 397]KAG8804432.1 hypothetical protein FRC16_008954 [Serendipita sp. 398]KAG8878112.1 hypothetical protein FRC20_009397 [Serendipita sp. 405]